MDGDDALPTHASSQTSERTALHRRRPSLVRVRLSEERDWPRLRRLVRLHHERTVFGHLPFSEAKYDALEAQARRPGRHQCLIVAEVREEVVGLVWFSAGGYALSDVGTFVTVHLLAVDPAHARSYVGARIFLRLLKAVRLWAESAQCGGVLLHVTTGTDQRATERLLHGAGAQRLGGSYLLATGEETSARR